MRPTPTTVRSVRTWPMARSLVAAAALAVLAAACGGGDATEDETPPADTAEDEAPGDGAPEDDAEDDVPAEDPADEPEEETPPADDPASGDLTLEEFLEVLEARELRPSQVTYAVDGSGDFAGAGTMTIAQDPPRSATQVENSAGGFITIQDGDAAVSCFTEGSAWQCFSLDLGTGMEDMFTGDDPLSDLPDLEDLDEGDRPDRISRDTIVSRSAICIEYDEMTDGARDVQICFDEETGALLRSVGTSSDGVTFSIEATAFGAPDPDIFTPPAPVTDIGGMLPTG
jgi:hypothetical protein